MTTTTLTIKKPDDWHLHLRDGAVLKAALPFTANRFSRAIVMPNLNPPVTSAALANAYKARILAVLPTGSPFQPLMTLYLTDTVDPDELTKGFAEGHFVAAKLYPANATTNSAFGVSDIRKIEPAIKRMAEIGMPLLVHGEVTDPSVDIFDREAVFIDTILKPLLDRVPNIKLVLEHITTEQAVNFVTETDANVGATITSHHLLINRSDIFKGGIRPHLYCLPIAKREKHRVAVRAAATSGNAKFFLGTDSAPHVINAKESACGCAGIFNAPSAIEIYASIFDEDGKLDNLEAFASLNGPAFYNLPINDSTITLIKRSSMVDEILTTSDGQDILPFKAGETLSWTFLK